MGVIDCRSQQFTLGLFRASVSPDTHFDSLYETLSIQTMLFCRLDAIFPEYPGIMVVSLLQL
jgi:hypothetical protein